jgi:hypothetical protein
MLTIGWFLKTFMTVGRCLKTCVTIGWCLQIYKKKKLWFSPERVSTLNIVSSSCYIYMIASLRFMNFKRKNISLY